MVRLRDETAIPARIIEASARGLRLELDRYLTMDTPVRLSLHEEIVLGRVRYCIPASSGEYFVGLQLEETLASLDDLVRLSRALETPGDSKPNGVDGVVETAEKALPETLG